MIVEIQLEKTSQPLQYPKALNTYTKGPLYCILFERSGKRITHKFPLCNVFRIIEEYGDSKR